MLSERGKAAAAAVKLLQGARDYIADPSRWTQEVLHRGSRSCAIGAVARAAKRPLHENTRSAWHGIRAETGGKAALDALSRAIPGDVGIVTFNDRGSTKHSDILMVFDQAIKAECQIVQDDVKPPPIDSSLWTGR